MSDMYSGIKVKDVMTKGVVTVEPDTSVQEVAKLMKELGIGSVIVLGESPGIITKSDLVRDIVAEGRDPKTVKAKDIMKTPLRAIPPDIDIEEAMKTMRDLNIKRVVVMKKGKIVGILSERDIIRIEPALSEIIKFRAEIENPPYFPEEQSLSGECELCGSYSDDLRFVNGKYLCENCRGE